MSKNKKLLIVIGMQNDLITGSLGTPEARAILPRVESKIKYHDGDVWYALETHINDYLTTREGRVIPVKHCIDGTPGWEMPKSIATLVPEDPEARNMYTTCAFASSDIATRARIEGYTDVEFVGICTDRCIIANALMMRSYCTEANISVDASCCAGSDPRSHQIALDAMKMCHIDIINQKIVECAK